MDENTSTPPASQSGGNKNMMLIGLFVLIVVGVIGFIVLMGRRSATPVIPKPLNHLQRLQKAQ
ncbi:MAG: hypothetical protein HYV40_00365 [Candidatus Levybacteria bacterium]|nr:hypothetical protein [Candidatus Levybacteria bacterium]